MKPKADDSILAFGAASLLKQVQAMRQEIEGIRIGQDIEPIHRMRVASRRLRANLTIFSEYVAGKKGDEWQKQIKNITRALGTARDLDIQIDLLAQIFDQLTETTYRAGLRRLLLRLNQKRLKAQTKVLETLEGLEKRKVLEQIEKQLTPLLQSPGSEFVPTANLFYLANHWINIGLENFLAYEVFLPFPDKKAELHAMRIAAKRLRYSLEIFSALYEDGLNKAIQTTRSAQDTLGAIHDCDVWGIFLPQFIQQEQERTLRYYGYSRPIKRLLPGIVYFQENRLEERNRLYAKFIKDWQNWKDKNIWQNLLSTIAVIPVDEAPPAPPAPRPESPTEPVE